MKFAKKFNIEQKIGASHLDVTKHFRYYLIAPAVLLLVAFVLLFTVGFNKSIDFTGGSVARVYVGTEYTYEQAKDKIDLILENKGLQASLYQQTEDEGKQYVTVKYQNDSSMTENQITAVNLQIVDDLFTSFGYDQEDMQQASYVEGNQRIDASLGFAAIVSTFGGVVIASVLLFAYFWIRYGHRSAATALLCVYHDILVALSLALIFRIELNLTFLAAVVAIFVYSFINTALLFAAIGHNIEEKMPAKQIANNAIKSHLHLELDITWLMLIMLVLFSIVGVTSILPFSILAVFGVLASFYSVFLLAPNLWALVYVPAKKKVKKETSKEVV